MTRIRTENGSEFSIPPGTSWRIRKPAQNHRSLNGHSLEKPPSNVMPVAGGSGEDEKIHPYVQRIFDYDSKLFSRNPKALKRSSLIK